MPRTSPAALPPATVLELLTRHHPALGARDVAWLGEGDFHRAYVVDGAWVVRVARHAEAADSLRREACLLPRLAPRLPLAIPVPVLTFEGDGVDPAFAVHAIVAGTALGRERWEALPESQRERCARSVGAFLATLHEVDVAPARACGVPEIDYGARCDTIVEEARATLFPGLAAAARAAVERAAARQRASAGAHAYTPVLLHGDLSPDHVLYDPSTGDPTGVIDFGDMAIGDPAWDLGYLYEDYGPDFLRLALPAVRAREEHRALLTRMRTHLELDAVAWGVRRGREGDVEGVADAMRYLHELQERGLASNPEEEP